VSVDPVIWSVSCIRSFGSSESKKNKPDSPDQPDELILGVEEKQSQSILVTRDSMNTVEWHGLIQRDSGLGRSVFTRVISFSKYWYL